MPRKAAVPDQDVQDLKDVFGVEEPTEEQAEAAAVVEMPPQQEVPTELVPVQHEVATPMPVFQADEMTEAYDAYLGLQKALDDRMPDAIMDIQGKKFRKKIYWRTIARAFNLSVGMIPGTDERVDTGSDWGYTAVYRASAPGGAHADGDGTCMASEKNVGRMKATEHNVKSHAHTRAFNRAVSNLVGFGEVSADEMNLNEPTESTQTEKDMSVSGMTEGQYAIAEVWQGKSGTSNSGRPWTIFNIRFEDGTVATTFKSEEADEANRCKEAGIPVSASLTRKGKYVNIDHLRGSDVGPDPI